MPAARSRSAIVHRLPAAGPDDVEPLVRAVEAGRIDPRSVVAILGKTEGNGCVNDFSRGFATRALKHALASLSGRSREEIARSVALVMSGGTEGGLSPHWLVFEVRESVRSSERPTLALGVAMTHEFRPEEIGRAAQIVATAEAVKRAMRDAAIDDPADVHYVQVKCPLLTKQRIAECAARGATVVTEDTYRSMGYSRGAAALGTALALGEIDERSIRDDVVCSDASLWSSRASTSAGIELMQNQVMVLGNSRAWSSDFVVAHDVMRDAIDVTAVQRALEKAGVRGTLPLDERDRERIAAVLAKAEPSQNGTIRGRRHVMLDDSDIQASRHARALVGGVLAGVFGDTQLFVSGGAEHQGPDGGGPVAVIARTA